MEAAHNSFANPNYYGEENNDLHVDTIMEQCSKHQQGLQFPANDSDDINDSPRLAL